MKVENVKDLQKVINLCRKTGVTSIKLDGLELVLGPLPIKANSTPSKYTDFSADFPESSIPIPQYQAPETRSEEVKAIADKIATDELSEEQLMFYSAQGHVEQ